ncbi:MAG TPA: TatD family deoxyribonuclease, partial [Bordetella sp.]|nr:TatD family deoxyribonuclease [Bordetella sp.]
IPPAWLHPPMRRNDPTQLPRIAQVLAELRGADAGEIAQATTATARRLLPRLAA